MPFQKVSAVSIVALILSSSRVALALTMEVASSGSTGTPAYWNDMLHYIDFEGTTTDAKGNGVITDSNGNCDTLGSYVEGVSGPGSQAFHWDTTGWAGCIWLLTPNVGVSATEWSFSFWYKPDTTQSPGSPRLDWLYGLPSWSGINCYGCYHFTMNRNGDPDLEMYHYGPQMSSPTFNAGQWYNFFVSQGPSTFSLYVDGVLQQSVSKTAVAGDGVPIRILVASGGGAIDDLIFYSKGFTDAEVTTLGGTPPTPAAPAAGGGGGAAAVGDPHLQNVHGERFDLMKPGKHVLINIPRGTNAEHALLRVQADARQVGEQCADMYFQELNITGEWVEAKGTDSIRFQAQDMHDEKPKWMKFGHVQMKVAHGRTQNGAQYLNFYVKHLGHSGHAVGGLLGEDDHADAAMPSEACVHRMALLQVTPQSNQGASVSVAEASFT